MSILTFWKYAKQSRMLKNNLSLANKTKTNFILKIKKVEIKKNKQIREKKL